MTEPLTATELRKIFDELGACDPALVWLDQQINEAPGVSPLDLWTKVVKMRRTPTELEYDRERRKEEPTWKPDNDTHTGWSWISWVTHRAQLSCSSGTFSGRRKTYDGPNADQVNMNDVLASIASHWGWIARGEEEPDV